MSGRTAALLAMAAALGGVAGCGGALPAGTAGGPEAGVAGPPGVRIAAPLVVEPRSAEAAAATKARGDAVALAGGTCLRGTTAGLVIGRIDPDTGGWFESAVVYLPGAAVDVAVSGTAAFVSLGPAGVAVVDIAEPAVPKPLALIETPGSAMRLCVEGGRLAVAAGHAGVLLFDVEDPARPRLTGAWSSEGYVRQAVIDGERLLVAEGRAGLSQLAVERDGSLRHAWRVPTAGEARALAVRSGGSGTRIIAVADGSGGLALLAAGGDGPAAEAGRLALPDMARDVAFHEGGRFAFVADGDRGVVTIDVRDPASPRLAGTLATDRPVNRVRPNGSRLLVGNDSAGLLVLDATDPAALAPVAAPAPGE